MIYILALLLILNSSYVLSEDGPQNVAILGEVLTNVSSLVGGTAQFYCEVVGMQALDEQLKFVKVDAVGGETVLSVDDVVTDSSKHAISDTYRLSISSVSVDDEGQYQCALGTKQVEVAYLAVLDPPSSASLYWPGGKSWTEKNVQANLTCEAGTSRPPASFRWFRGQTEITAISINPSVSVDSNGYGKGMSMLELTPDMYDEGVMYSCHVDVPGLNNAVVERINVAFSGTGHVIASVCLVLTSLLASFKA